MNVFMTALAVALATAQAASPSIQVRGQALQPTTLTHADLERLPQQSVEAQDAGQTVRFTGPLVSDVLARGGVTFGQTLRGPRLAEYVVIEAADGYAVVYALAELDPQFTDAVVILALAQDGKTPSGWRRSVSGRRAVPRSARPMGQASYRTARRASRGGPLASTRLR